ncbi:MAG: ThuA domain-containing protein [Bacteroidota bacterium]
MKRILTALLLLALVGGGLYWWLGSSKKEIKVLVFSKTEGFRHESIAAAQQAIFKLGQQHQFSVDTTEDATYFKESQLKNYNVVIFLNTTGDVLNDAQQLEFNRFIQAGGGFVGIHAAADTEYDWPWYGQLVGAYFNGHPNNPNVREAIIQRKNQDHPASKRIPLVWRRKDEWYNYKQINPSIKVLLNLDETSYEGGTNGPNHPIAWCHEFDGGRSFYTGLGHTEESYQEAEMLDHLWGGIDYAAGPGQPVNYNLSTVAPEENRFVKTVLKDHLDEPMELEILPNGHILFIERGGAIKEYQPTTKEVKTVHELAVHKEHEDGLLGMAIDPKYADNHWIYLFYSPKGEVAKQHVSRFVYQDGLLDMASEKVVLEIPVQREECCHSAGSLEFGPEGNLFISTGDNTNPHFSDGYNPIDEREGRAPFDAQKSSANANDLRGKILRISPQADGTYTIPKGNLFPKGSSKGKPEIYIMGCRNPYRIAIDQHNGYLYWGDIGPDAGEDSLGRGPMGYDEINQAREAGFFGWPYFIGDNKAYEDYDFAQQVALKSFDPTKPINVSPNNTGIQELPPAQPAMIWYPYGSSKEFPALGDGGRNAMAAGVFYAADYPKSEQRFPDYYDKKLFVYDWMRGWIMAVTLDEEQQLERIERFLPSMEFNNPVDVVFGPNGDLYLLEYGTIWFSDNPDARLVHLEYVAGNRQPLAQIAADKPIGAAPLKVQFDATASKDYDGDELRFEWYFTDTAKVQSNEVQPSFTFTEPGEYEVRLVVNDQQGESASSSLKIMVGNEPPNIAWKIDGNRSFFFDQQKIGYSIEVSDAEDGQLNKGIPPAAVALSIDYLARGKDANIIAMGHQQMTEATQFIIGKKLMEESDCKTCHQEAIKSVGPSYQAIATKYKEDDKAVKYLANRIIKGGGGVWGQIVMAAHPQLSPGEAEQMSKYILSLSGQVNQSPGLPLKGSYPMNQHRPGENTGSYILSATYTDRGGKEIGPLTARDILHLKHPLMASTSYTWMEGAMKFEVKKGMAPGVEEDFEIVIGSPAGYIGFEQIDLTDIRSINLFYAAAPNFFGGGQIEIRIDAPDGPVIGDVSIEQGLTDFGMKEALVSLKETQGMHDLYIFFKESAEEGKPITALINLEFSLLGGEDI